LGGLVDIPPQLWGQSLQKPRAVQVITAQCTAVLATQIIAVRTSSRQPEPGSPTCHCSPESFLPDTRQRRSVPLLKKAGLDSSLPANYRPISSLSTASKVLERLVLARLRRHLLGSSNFSELQCVQEGAFHRDCTTGVWKSWTEPSRRPTTSKSLC